MECWEATLAGVANRLPGVPKLTLDEGRWGVQLLSSEGPC